MRVPSPRYGHVRMRDRGRLPHWETDDGVYSVNFRLVDSLPQGLLAQLEAERQTALAALARRQPEPTDADRRRIKQLFNERVDAYLDAGTGACYLARRDVGELTASAVRHFDGERYRLYAWCVMPNHVHAVFRLLGAWKLESTLHSWKSFTAKQANRLLGRRGAFWAREYYDHLVRDEEEFRRIVAYVAENPAKAGLRDWPFVWVCPECSGGARE